MTRETGQLVFDIHCAFTESQIQVRWYQDFGYIVWIMQNVRSKNDVLAKWDSSTVAKDNLAEAIQIALQWYQGEIELGHYTNAPKPWEKQSE